MSSPKFEQYTEVINELGGEAIACCPETWHSATLKIDCDGNAINYSLKSTDDDNRAEISNELRTLCEQLYVVMRQNGEAWVLATLVLTEDGDSWGMTIDFEYANNDPETAEPAKKPWWKIW